MYSGLIKDDQGLFTHLLLEPRYLGNTEPSGTCKDDSSPSLGPQFPLWEPSRLCLSAPQATRERTRSFRSSFTHQRLAASRRPAPPASRRRRLRLHSGGPAVLSASRRCRHCCRRCRRARIWREPRQPPRPARRLDESPSRDSPASGKEVRSACPRENCGSFARKSRGRWKEEGFFPAVLEWLGRTTFLLVLRNVNLRILPFIG